LTINEDDCAAGARELIVNSDHHIKIFHSDQLRSRRALADLTAGIKLWRLWLMLGWLDIRQRYRRAMIGPFWITISMIVMIGSMGVLYSSLFGVDVNQFIPFLAAGFCVWFLISSTITEGASLFIQAEDIIRNADVPIGMHAFRLLWRNIIVFGHNAVVMLLVYAFFHLNPGLPLLLEPVGALVVLVNLGGLAILVGSVCTRFRDAPPIVGNLVQIAFFISPVMYKPDLLVGKLTAFAVLNPFYYLLEVMRAPLLGLVPPIRTYAILLAITCTNLAMSFLFYRRFRSRIAYWL
jgi:lipopolysaccharide transport system permease protein